jgi:hypothetical protein
MTTLFTFPFIWPARKWAIWINEHYIQPKLMATCKKIKQKSLQWVQLLYACMYATQKQVNNISTHTTLSHCSCNLSQLLHNLLNCHLFLLHISDLQRKLTALFQALEINLNQLLAVECSQKLHKHLKCLNPAVTTANNNTDIVQINPTPPTSWLLIIGSINASSEQNTQTHFLARTLRSSTE